MKHDRPTPPTLLIPSATTRLKELMAAANIPSFRALARQAGVSDWSISQLRRDRITSMRLDILQKIAAALGVSLPTLLSHFGVDDSAQAVTSEPIAPADANSRIATLEAEYQRLQTQLDHQADDLRQQFQAESLAILESWLVQWPTVAHAVDKNPDLPASRVVPLVQPVHQLLEQWGVEAIAPVGAELEYDPQQHQLMDGNAAPGDRVKVRYAGFRHGSTLLHRAKVSPIA